MDRYELGKIGEDAVALYLDRRGCKILDRNFRTRNGEIDIIFFDDGELVFGEVKTRSSTRFGLPSEAVDENKRNKIITVARQYISANIYEIDVIRFDVFEVFYERKKIKHIKNAYYS